MSFMQETCEQKWSLFVESSFKQNHNILELKMRQFTIEFQYNMVRAIISHDNMDLQRQAFVGVEQVFVHIGAIALCHQATLPQGRVEAGLKQ